MIRKKPTRQTIPFLLTPLAVLTSLDSPAAGLGEMRVLSALGEPLYAEMPIVQQVSEGFNENEFVAAIGNSELHGRMNITKPIGHQGVRLKVISKPDGDLVLTFASEEPVFEPILNFVVRLEWPGGKIVKEIAALLDPPDSFAAATLAPLVWDDPGTGTAPVQTLPPRRSKPPKPPKSYPAGSYPAGSEYGPVMPFETLSEIAGAVAPSQNTGVHTMMQRLHQANPDAFIDNNINKLRQGVMLTVPDVKLSANTAAPAKTNSPNPGSEPSTDRNSKHDEYGPVEYGETLSGIAASIAHRSGGDSTTLMHEIFARNPHAFVDNDINRLRTGVLLSVAAAPQPTAAKTETAAAPEVNAKAQTEAVNASEEQAAPPQATPADPAPAVIENVAEEPASASPGAPVPGATPKQMQALTDQAGGDDAEVILSARISAQQQIIAELKTVLQEQKEYNQDLEQRLAALEQILTATQEHPHADVGDADAGSAEPPASEPAASILHGTLPKWIAGTMLALLLGYVAWRVVRYRSQSAAQVATRRFSSGNDQRAKRTAPEAPAATPKTITAEEMASSLSDTIVFEHTVELREPVNTVPLAEVPGSAGVARDAQATLKLSDVTSDEITETIPIFSPTQPQKTSKFAKEAAMYMAYGDYQEAQTKIEKAIAEEPEQLEHKLALLSIYSASGQYDNAYQLLDVLENGGTLASEVKRRTQEIRSALNQSHRKAG